MNIKLEAVSKQFIRKREDSNLFYAVENADIEIQSGVITCLSGPSGSGKTTLLSMVSGLMKPTAGNVRFDEIDIYSMDDKNLTRFRNTHIGVVPQGQTALQSLTVYENIVVPYTFSRRKSDEADTIKQRAEELLVRTGIKELSAVMPSELSGGELRRMAVARALVMSPEVILADEPTADLDEENTELVLSILREEAVGGKTVLVVTHDPKVISFADVVYHMNKGKIEKKE